MIPLFGGVCQIPAQEVSGTFGEWYAVRSYDPGSRVAEFSFTADCTGHPSPWSADHPPALIVFFSLAEDNLRASVETKWKHPVSRLMRPNIHYFFGADLGPDLWMVTSGGNLLQPDTVRTLLFVEALLARDTFKVETIASDNRPMSAVFRTSGLEEAIRHFPELARHFGFVPWL